MVTYFENWVEDINILIWNLHSSDPQGGKERGKRLGDERQDSIQYIVESTKRATNIPLFLCCQERITKEKHDLICNLLGLDPAAISNEGEEVNTYYWNVSPQQVDYIVTDGEVEKGLWQEAGRESKQRGIGRYFLRGSAPTSSSQDNIGQARDQSYAAVPSTSQSVPQSDNTDDRLLTRLRACVFHPSLGSSKSVLIVSWHGPQLNKNGGTLSAIKKKRVFGTLLLFVELLRDRHDCQLAVIGGDFNLFDTAAKEHINLLQIKARVYSDYKPPKDKSRSKIQEFMVVLPKAGLELEVAETSVHHQYYKRERPRMFDHPIVRFRLTVSPNLNSEQPTPALPKEEATEERGEREERGVEETSSPLSTAAVAKPATELKAAEATLKAEAAAATVAATSAQNVEDSAPAAQNENNDDEKKDRKQIKRKEKNAMKKKRKLKEGEEEEKKKKKRKLKEGEEEEKKKKKMHDEWTEQREMLETIHFAAAAAADDDDAAAAAAAAAYDDDNDD